jgi:hypothetical protein
MGFMDSGLLAGIEGTKKNGIVIFRFKLVFDNFMF